MEKCSCDNISAMITLCNTSKVKSPVNDAKSVFSLQMSMNLEMFYDVGCCMYHGISGMKCSVSGDTRFLHKTRP